ncbi:MAG: transcription termination/antitermination protein NusA [Thermoguttaceae bacterium]|nr:transcription termination/antitermination protein NusA [Thermoguttaceae bacterium]
MNPDEILRLVEQINLESGVDKEVIFECVENALLTVAQHRGTGVSDHAYSVTIDRQTGEICIFRDGVPMKLSDVIERTGAITARQIISQRIREEERAKFYENNIHRQGELVLAEAVRAGHDGVFFTIDGGSVEAYLPNANKIRGEVYVWKDKDKDKDSSKEGDRRRSDSSDQQEKQRKRTRRFWCVIEKIELNPGRNKDGRLPQVVLSRKSPKLVERLFESECPEIKNGQVKIVSCARAPGQRAKVAVTAVDPSIAPNDVLGPFLGKHSERCNSVSKRLCPIEVIYEGDKEVPSSKSGNQNLDDRNNGERVDVIVWNPDENEFIRNALKPAEVNDIILCPRLDRAIVLVDSTQRSLAIGKGGQNVKLAKKLCGWELEILRSDEKVTELDELLSRATRNFQTIPGLTPENVEALISEGFLSFDDLTNLEVEDFSEICGVSDDLAKKVIGHAEAIARRVESLTDFFDSVRNYRKDVRSKDAHAKEASPDPVVVDSIDLLAIGGVENWETLKTISSETMVDRFGLSPDQADEVVRSVHDWLEALALKAQDRGRRNGRSNSNSTPR